MAAYKSDIVQLKNFSLHVFDVSQTITNLKEEEHLHQIDVIPSLPAIPFLISEYRPKVLVSFK